jgi:uncharacterized protein YuzE
MPVIIAKGEIRTIPLSIWLDGTMAERGGALSNGLLVGEFTLAIFDHAFADDGTVFTDETTEAGDAGANDMTLMPAAGGEAVGDAYYFGNATKFAGMKIVIGTSGVGDTVLFEYWNGTAWTNLATAHKLVDDTSGLTVGPSTVFVTWEVPTDWTTKTVNSVTEYWMRIRVSAANFGTSAIGTQAWVLDISTGLGIAVPCYGKIQKASFSCLTISGTDADTVFQIINFTQGTVDSITFTKGTEADTDATVDLDVDKGDIIGIQLVQEDGTTEFANIQLVLEIEAFG